MTYIHLNLGGAVSQPLAQCQAHRREISWAAQRCGPWFPTLWPRFPLCRGGALDLGLAERPCPSALAAWAGVGWGGVPREKQTAPGVRADMGVVMTPWR